MRCQLPEAKLGMDGMSVTVWTVEKDARGWSVVAEREGARVEPRRSLTGLRCLRARVLAQELNSAYREGIRLGGEEVRAVFAELLGD